MSASYALAVASMPHFTIPVEQRPRTACQKRQCEKASQNKMGETLCHQLRAKKTRLSSALPHPSCAFIAHLHAPKHQQI
jgi:hypothetical protein